jgi:cell division protein FtsZ
MREGPLAALFRKTETEGLGEAPGRPRPEAAEERRIPTPQERLRNAFSSDVPEDVMAPPARDRQVPPPSAADYQWGAPAPQEVGQPQLRVVGVGGGGVNAVNRMIEAEVRGVQFIALNTDRQSLQQSDADVTMQIGGDLTRGLGSGSNPDLGRSAAMEDYDRVKAMLKGSDMVFITAGEGGGTGTGAAPVVARIARELGALTVGIVTKPFGFEGSRRMQAAENGILALQEEVDTLITVPNNRLLTVLDKQTSMVDAFKVADDVLRQGVQGISDLITLPGLINLDFADVRTIMSEAGNALLGIGMGTGEKRALDAAAAATSSPLLETTLEGARGILLSMTGGKDLSLWEVNEAAKAVQEAAHPDANIIFGAMIDEKLEDEVWITVVATGYGEKPSLRPTEERLRDEFRVSRGDTRREREPARVGRGVDVDVPEFIPRY